MRRPRLSLASVPPARSAGFTLTQLGAAVAVLAVLAMMAVPGYRQHLEQTHRAAARAALADIAQRQERYRADRRQYARTLGKLGWNSGTIYLYREGTLTHVDTPDAIYEIRLEGRPSSGACPPGGSPHADGYTVVAEPIRAQATDARCGAICLSSTGARSASGLRGEECWQG